MYECIKHIELSLHLQKMGGSALGFQALRMNNDRYIYVKDKLISKLLEHYIDVAVPVERVGKIDHGDLDLICLKHGNMQESANVKEMFNSSTTVKNGHILHFEFERHQIDLIHVYSRDQFDFARVFYSYGDLGMILGMMCKLFRLSVSDRKFHVEIPEHNTKIILTSNVWEMLSFLGLSRHEYENGFINEEQVFKWITTCKYFRPQMFKTEDLSNKRKKRLDDRPMFMNFIEYCNIQSNFKTTYPNEKFDSKVIFKEALNYFDKNEEYSILLKDKELSEALKLKLNGKIVIQNFPKITGRDIGKIITAIKQKHTVEEIITMNEQDINQIIRDVWIKLNGEI